jgi:gluconate 5-dehydrogenase
MYIGLLLKQSSNRFTINDRVVIVTGSNRGIGYAVANELKNQNAKVIRIGRNFDSSIGTDDRVLDLNSHSEIQATITKIVSDYGRIDALVNNAGISVTSDHPYSDLETYDRTLSVNLTAAFLLCGAVCPTMQEQARGSIINITSIGAQLGFPDNPAYQISKAGLRQLTKAIARDWGSFGIRANNVCPGYIRTGMTEKSYKDNEHHFQRLNQTLLKRWGETSDLVGPIIFLISDASDYMTGCDLYIDGGWTANGGL